MNWQPIETAPIKPFDKEKWYMSASPHVLLYCPFGDNFGTITIGAFSYTKFGKGRWSDGVTKKPTHWMPLPEPPQ